MKIKKTESNKNEDIIAISEQYTKPERPSYICNFCSRDLVRLVDSSGNNEDWYCRRCNTGFIPDKEDVRSQCKLKVTERNTEVCVSTTPGVDYESVGIRKEPEIKGAFKTLKEKGLKFTSYNEGVG
jgi:hypothetical protein